MTEQEIKELDKASAKKMRKFGRSDDTEGAHHDGDALLCELLLAIGFEKTVKEFKSLYKWYA